MSSRLNTGRIVTLEPMHDTMIGSDLKTTSMLFLGVVGFVLLICCANVANLLLARQLRARVAVRSALGAGRRRSSGSCCRERRAVDPRRRLGIVGAAILQWRRC